MSDRHPFLHVWRAKARERIKAHSQVFANTAWLLADRGLTIVLTMVTHVWVARYLGTNDFGALSYSTAFVGLFGALTYLGFSPIVTRDLVSNPEARNELLGTTFCLKLAGAIMALTLAVSLSFWNIDDDRIRTMVQIQSAALLADGFTVIVLWYYARVEARYAVAASTVGALGAAAVKIALITMRMPVVWFGLAAAAQTVLTSVALCVIYSLQGNSIFALRFRMRRARELLAQSWPLAISAIVATLYFKLDQVMLGYMTDVSTVGTYSVAAKLSESWYVLPATVATSLFPGLVSARESSAPLYEARLQLAYRYMSLAAFAVAIPMTFAAVPIIRLIYGEEYVPAARLLAVHIWACPAIFMGTILSRWLVLEGLFLFSLARDIVGAAVNVLLNFLLIPRIGALGAAVATVISYTVASYLCCFFHPRTVGAGVMMTRAFLFPILFWYPRPRPPVS